MNACHASRPPTPFATVNQVNADMTSNSTAPPAAATISPTLSLERSTGALSSLSFDSRRRHSNHVAFEALARSGP